MFNQNSLFFFLALTIKTHKKTQHENNSPFSCYTGSIIFALNYFINTYWRSVLYFWSVIFWGVFYAKLGVFRNDSHNNWLTDNSARTYTLEMLFIRKFAFSGKGRYCNPKNRLKKSSSCQIFCNMENICIFQLFLLKNCAL